MYMVFYLLGPMAFGLWSSIETAIMITRISILFNRFIEGGIGHADPVSKWFESVLIMCRSQYIFMFGLLGYVICLLGEVLCLFF